MAEEEEVTAEEEEVVVVVEEVEEEEEMLPEEEVVDEEEVVSEDVKELWVDLWYQDLDLMIQTDPFQLGIFCDSVRRRMIYRIIIVGRVL